MIICEGYVCICVWGVRLTVYLCVVCVFMWDVVRVSGRVCICAVCVVKVCVCVWGVFVIVCRCVLVCGCVQICVCGVCL